MLCTSVPNKKFTPAPVKRPDEVANIKAVARTAGLLQSSNSLRDQARESGRSIAAPWR